MHRWMQVGGKNPDGSSRIGSLPNPRRNTSKEIFERFSSGDKLDTCIRFVSTLSPLFRAFIIEVDTQRIQGGYMSPLADSLSSIKREY
jgi:hypothetical protein